MTKQKLTDFLDADPSVTINTEIGQDSQIDEELVLALLLDFQSAPPDSKQRINARRAITEALLPTIERVAKRFGDYERSDLFQNGVVKVMTMLEKWDPSKSGTIGGFIRIGLQNYYTTLAEKQAKESGVMSLSQHEGLEEMLEDIPHNGLDLSLLITQLERSRPSFLKGKELAAYNHALQWFLDLTHNVDSLRMLTLEMTQQYGIPVRRAILLINHAKASLRMHLDSKAANPTLQDILTSTPNDSMFLRLVNWLNLPEETIVEMVKVFGGIEIHIPKGI